MGNRPCTLALAVRRVPAARFDTRADLLGLLEQVYRLIEDDPAAPLDLATLGREVGLSPYHLQRRFRAVYGETPHRIQHARRLEFAHALLKKGSSVQDACCESGFLSTSSFGRAFRAKFGSSPSEVKRT